MTDPRTDLDAKLEAEIQAALGDMSIDDLMTDSERPGGTPAPRGKSSRTLKKGLVVDVHGGDVLVEFGPKSQGVCSLDHFDEPPAPGTELEFFVDRFDEQDGILILSRKGAVAKAAWESLEMGQTVEARCTGTNKGGLEMEVARHEAFMPAGQVDVRHIADLSVFVGEKMPCEVIEIDRKRNRVILSRRAFLEIERQRTREELLAKIEVGQEVPGIVSSIQPYGCFVDLGGIDGLVHVSDLSYARVNDPHEVVKEGEQITVRILKIDNSEDPPKLSLGLKQTMADPFQSSAGELKEGGTATGRVTKLMDFGAFVEIAPGVEGLIHISELSHERVNRVDQVIRAGEIVTVKVLNVDMAQKRIGLSLKAMKSEADAMAPRQEDKAMEKLKARFGDGGDLKGGLG